ncbi:MAG: cytochrome P450 [Acidimicrobiales bacterium]
MTQLSESPLSESPLTIDDIDLSSIDFWLRPPEEREAAFALLRRERPVPFFEELALENLAAGPGYYCLTKYDDVMYASRHADLFASGRGTQVVDMPEELNDMLGSMINMDAPRHTKLRLLVNKGFTPRMVARIEDYVHDIARECVQEIVGKGSCDFVTEVAAPMPLRIICDMMGIPRSDAGYIFEQTNHLLGGLDPEYNETVADLFAGGWNLFDYAQKLGAERLENPKDDITTTLMQAEVEGQRLTAAELGSFFVLLCTAGNETTRNAIAHGLYTLTAHPDQRQLLIDDPDRHMPGFVEEIVRWSTPVIHFRRTVMADTELPSGRASFKEGDKVTLWYNSANRDEDAFDHPEVFDITRSPNEHVGFGGGGPHFCLGANLARRELRVLFEELFRVLPDIGSVGEPARLQSNFINGLKHLSAEFTPAA